MPAGKAGAAHGRRAHGWRRGLAHAWIPAAGFPATFLAAIVIAEPPRDAGYLLMVAPWVVVLALAGALVGAAAILAGAVARRIAGRPPGSRWASSRPIALGATAAYAIAFLFLVLTSA